MQKFVLQLHITNKCNKRCIHCYQEDYKEEGLSLEEIYKIIDEFIEIVSIYNIEKKLECIPQVNLTGGEPFVREDIFEILKYLNLKGVRFAILSNGSLFTNELVKKIKDYNPVFIQVSIEGGEQTTDEIRGENSYKEVLKALKRLNKYKIYSLVSFTASNKNFREFSNAVRLAQKGRANKIWTDRYVPKYGEEAEIKTLNSKELIEYITLIKKEQKSIRNKAFNTKIYGDRSLHFLNGHSQSYICSAGDNLLVVTENGDVMPCRRLDVIAGNIKYKSLKDIYFNSFEFRKLRCKIVPKGCEKCTLLNICKGGAKCISYGVYNTYTIGDFACPFKKTNP